MQLLTTNTKLAKCRDFGYLAAGLELAPGRMSGEELCAWRGDCYKTCLFFSGFGSMPSVRKARLARSRFMLKKRPEFHDQLGDELNAHALKSKRLGLKPAVRLNVFSDIPWEHDLPTVFDSFPEIQFYDYTKSLHRWIDSITKASWPLNYHLTFSCNEDNPLESRAVTRVLDAGGICTVVVRDASKLMRMGKTTLKGSTTFHAVVDGDVHDLTFLHPEGSIIVLAAKGKGGSRNPKKTEFIQ